MDWNKNSEPFIEVEVVTEDLENLFLSKNFKINEVKN